MSEFDLQNLKNHARFDPLYHFFIVGVLFVNLIFACFYLYRHRSVEAAWYLALSLAAIAPLLRLRQYPLKVQDRVIRLEERLRLQALTPAEWHSQIWKLSEDQLVGLRFANDDEVVALAKQALEHNLTRKQIKERIRNWRPDNWRV
jgi:Family of unknown function (DUF6526)